MTDHDQDAERSTADRSHPTRPAVTESEKFFEAERLEESRKRFATYSLWAGLLSLLLLLIPNPFPWLFGPVAILLGIHALVRMVLQPTHHAGKVRAVVGIIMGLVATTACRPWSNVLRYTHRRAVCESSLREIAQGLRQYHQDWEAFPRISRR